MAHSGFPWLQNTHKTGKEDMRAASKETPQAPSQEDAITACVAIKTVPLSARRLLIAISSPQLVPTQAVQVRLYNCPPEKQHNGVKGSVHAPDTTNVL